jgi:hypothetical protein
MTSTATPPHILRRKAAAVARAQAIALWRDAHDASLSMTAKHFAVSVASVSKAYAAHGRGVQFGSIAHCRTLNSLVGA